MSKNKIAFLKSLLLNNNAFALKVLNDPQYDNNPFINKKTIDDAIKKYGDKLDFLNNRKSNNRPKLDILNIEGHYLAQNIPEIPSIVIDEICTKEILYKTFDNYNITHIALSTYAAGLDKTIEIINIIYSEFKDKELYVGGVGTVYSQIQKLVPARNICVGNGVNWLRKKFNLKPLSPKEIKIPKISGNLINFPIKARTIYLVTQIGCPNTCDFCITHNFLKYSSFSKSKKIIEFIEDFSTQISRDGFIFLCEPNSLFPELTWKKVFEYFIENRKNFDNNLFLFFSSSLNHINKFDLEVIQHKSPLKFFMINYGIESTIKGYPKNQGDSKKVIERLNKLGVFTNHNYIIGLPFHTKEIINLEIRNNLGFNSDLFAVHTFKPIPSTLLYKQLELENSLYSNNVPHEFLYASGFLPFNHKYIGGGFEILKYFFKAIYEGEKKTIDVFDCFANKLLDLFAITNSRKIKKAVKVFMGMSKINLNSFQARMPNKFTRIFKKRIEITSQRYKKYVLGL